MAASSCATTKKPAYTAVQSPIEAWENVGKLQESSVLLHQFSEFGTDPLASTSDLKIWVQAKQKGVSNKHIMLKTASLKLV